MAWTRNIFQRFLASVETREPLQEVHDSLIVHMFHVLVHFHGSFPRFKVKFNHGTLLNVEFYIHSSVHRDSVLIRFNKMQQYAGIYLLQVYSSCLGRPSRPSSGIQ